MTTQAAVCQRVAEDLNIVPIGQAMEAQDNARVLTAYTETYARLKEKGLAVWAASADVPDKLTPDFVLLMLQRLLITYSVPDTRYQRIMAEAGPDGRMALLHLAELATPEYDDTASEGDF